MSAGIGARLIARAPFPLCLFLFLVAALSIPDLAGHALQIGIAAVLLLLTVAAGRRVALERPAKLVGILLLFAFCALLLVGLDVVVRKAVLPGKSHQSIFTQHDPTLGWRLRADFSVERESRHFTARETTNSRGFRTPEVPFEKGDGVRRVVVVGDSHTEGYTVGDDATYTRWMERLLSRDGPVEVISLGVGGFSTDQELLSYRHYGRKYEPDVVVLQVTRNDVEFNVMDNYWRGPKPRFARTGEQLTLTGVPVPNTRRFRPTQHWLFRHSAIAVVVEGYLARAGVTEDVKSTDLTEAWKVTELLVRDLAADVAADGAKLLLFNATPDEEEADGRFRELAARRGIPFLDIEPVFQGDIAAFRTGKKGDRHWNERGHEAVGRFLAEKLAPLLR